MDEQNDDPIIIGIREAADVIRYLGQNVQCYENAAWSKEQLVGMLDEISTHAEKILTLTGVANLKAHFEDVWGTIGERRNSLGQYSDDAPFRPYADS